MESLCSLKNPVLYELPNACYREQFPHFLRLTLHAEEYGTSLSENVLNLVHAKRIHFIDIQELIDAEKIESRTIHDLVLLISLIKMRAEYQSPLFNNTSSTFTYNSSLLSAFHQDLNSSSRGMSSFFHSAITAIN